MNRKFCVGIILIIILMMSIIPKGVYATNEENMYFNIYIPSRYKMYYENSLDDSEYKAYYAYEGDYYSTITVSAYQYSSYYMKPYTEIDLQNHVDLLKNLFEGYDFSIGSATMVELNGVQGYKITYYVRYPNTGREYGKTIYELKTDRIECELEIESSKAFINSSEVIKIINSFKIKDTVLKSRGIPFTDVATNQWYYGAVKYVYDRNMISGYNSYTFAPDDKLTRGQLVTILYRMEGQPAVSGKTKFDDVQDSKQYYYNAVKWATDRKIISGYNATKFGPNDNITREQLAVILNSYAKYKNKDYTTTGNLNEFKDGNTVSNFAVQQVKWAVNRGVITGYGDKTIKPQGHTTRAEAAAMLYKYSLSMGK